MPIAFVHNQRSVMALERPTEPFISRLPGEQLALRIGTNPLPEDVILGYGQSPPLRPEENIVWSEQLDLVEHYILPAKKATIAIANEQGEVVHAMPDENGYFQPAYPESVFPSDFIAVTNRFESNEWTIGHAYFYKWIVSYHYEKTSYPKDKWSLYQGQLIRLYDEERLPMDQSDYQILVCPQAANQNVLQLAIYLKQNTTKKTTLFLEYQHIGNAYTENELYVTKKQLPLFTDQHLPAIENNKRRVINATSAFSLKKQLPSDYSETDEWYTIDTHPQQNGYLIRVPQKTEQDPRLPTLFQYELICEYMKDGEKQELTFGPINDHLFDVHALLPDEKDDYVNDEKKLGIVTNRQRWTVKKMIDHLVWKEPIPNDAIYRIQDASGHQWILGAWNDDVRVGTSCPINGQGIATAKTTTTHAPWPVHEVDAIQYQSQPITHDCHIVAEYYPQTIYFSWEAEGVGEIAKKETYPFQWRLVQDLAVSESNVFENTSILKQWKMIPENKQPIWSYEKILNEITPRLKITKNVVQLNGVYHPGKDKMTSENYTFSADVYITDDTDDDVIGLLFRVQSDRQYYMFAWERDHLITKQEVIDRNDAYANGAGRVLISDQGISAVMHSKEIEGYDYEPNFSLYEKMGLGKKKKRIYKASKSKLKKYGTTGVPKTKYESDYSDTSYFDLTNYANNYNGSGWVPFRKYRITVEVAKNQFKIYVLDITDLRNVDPNDKGKVVCVGSDQAKAESRYQMGSFGVFSISQKEVYWSRLIFKPLSIVTVKTNYYSDEFLSMEQKRLYYEKNKFKSASDLIEPFIRQTLNGKTIEAKFPIAVDCNKSVTGKLIDDYPYAKFPSGITFPVSMILWNTADHQKNVQGSGVLALQPDGTYQMNLTPRELSVELPENVRNFKWTKATDVSGKGVNFTIYQNQIQASYNGPTRYDLQPLVSFSHEIEKRNGLQKIGMLVNEFGFSKTFELPATIPIHELAIRIERGNFDRENSDLRVNYRFLYESSLGQQFDVDQINRGENRLMLSRLLQNERPIIDQVELLQFSNTHPTLGSGMYIGHPLYMNKWKLDTTSDSLTLIENRRMFSGFASKTHLDQLFYDVTFSFSAIKDKTGGVDDDLICFLFKVQDPLNFYMLVIESDMQYAWTGVKNYYSGRFSANLGADNEIHIVNTPEQNWIPYTINATPYVSNQTLFEQEYRKKMGWGAKHKKIYRVINGILTLQSIEPIQNQHLGWKLQQRHTVRIQNSGASVKVFFDERLCFDLTTEFGSGSYGFGSISQAVTLHGIETKTYEQTLKKNVSLHVSAWTHFEEWKAVPVFAVRTENENRIQVNLPVMHDKDAKYHQWHLRIQKGMMERRLFLPPILNSNDIPMIYQVYPELQAYQPTANAPVSELVLHYHVVEFGRQPFFVEPILMHHNQLAKITGKKEITVYRGPISLYAYDANLPVEVTCMRGAKRFLLTVVDVDSIKGKIFVRERLQETDEVYVTYAQHQKEVDYKGFIRQNQWFGLNLNPVPGHQFQMATELYRQLVPHQEDDQSYQMSIRPSHELLAHEFELYMMPASIGVMFNGSYQHIKNTGLSQAVYHTTDRNCFDPKHLDYQPHFAHLGTVCVRHNSLMQHVILKDARKRGGGLHRMIESNEQTNQFWDVHGLDDRFYSPNGVVIVHVDPQYKEMYGKDEIERIVNQYKALGIHAIVEWISEV